jgi:hypothetical protein
MTTCDFAATRRLIERLRDRCADRRQPVSADLRALLETAAAMIERQADTIAALRRDCAAATVGGACA